MSPTSSVDVLICGAGASGLTLAIELARRGVRFRLIEKEPVPFRGSRGKGIQPRTLEIYEDLGVVNRMIATGGPYPHVRHHAPTAAIPTPPRSRSLRRARPSRMACRSCFPSSLPRASCATAWPSWAVA